MQRLAPAKVNLFLHVGAPGSDGYHPLHTLIVFADIGDTLAFSASPDRKLSVQGPFAQTLAGEADNLVTRARDLVMAAAGMASTDFGLRLHKALPIAAGLGGGSSDAAATMRLLQDGLAIALPDASWRDIAEALGSDVPACLFAAPVIATGRGERLAAAPPFPDLHVVLVNPGVPSPTQAVYRGYDAAIAPQGADAPTWPATLAHARDMADFLSCCRNDLQAPAVAINPAIGEALDTLAAAPETLLARMSGSGATSFALCADAMAARGLAERLSQARSDWWVRPCVLGGSHRGPENRSDLKRFRI